MIEQLYHTGQLLQLVNEYESTVQTISDDGRFLLVKAYQETQNWQKAKAILRELCLSDSQRTCIKASLYLDSLDFVLEYQSRNFGGAIIKRCDDILAEGSDQVLGVFAVKTKFRIQAALITLGLANGVVKWDFIEKISDVLDHYFQIDPGETVSLLNLLVSHGLSAPLSNPDRCLELFNRHKQVLSYAYDQSIGSETQLLKAEVILKGSYRKHSSVNVHKLPDALESICQALTNSGHVCGKELVEGMYGSHLLRLDCIEGMDWLPMTTINKLWQYGHTKPVLSYKKQALSWASDRAQTDLLHQLSHRFKGFKTRDETPVSQDIEKLNLSHKYFSQGDYDLGRKVLSEHLDSMYSETNRVHFITLMANNADRLEADKTGVIKMLVSELGKLKEVKYSVLLAQLYNFRAIVQNNKSLENYQKAINQFISLGLHDEAIEQFINLFLEQLIQRVSAKASPLVNDEMVQWLGRAETLIEDSSWTKYPLVISGNLKQTLGKASFYLNKQEEAQAYLEKAHEYFIEAGHLQNTAMNANYLILSLIKSGRQSKNIKYYKKAVRLVEDSLPIYERSNLSDFLWRMQFHMALCLNEPLQYDLVTDGDRETYIERAGKAYIQTVDTLDVIFENTRSLSPSERLLAVSQLNKSSHQLIFSGFYFFLLQRQWKGCIYWLERNRNKSLTAAIAKAVKVQETISHPLLSKEAELQSTLSTDSLSIAKQKSLQAALKGLYSDMLNEPILRSYASKKLEEVPSFEELRKEISLQEKHLPGKLFFLYFYTHGSDIYAFGVGTEHDEPLVKKIELSAQALDMALQTQFSEILKTHAYEKSSEPIWTQFSELISPLSEWTKPGDIIGIIPYGLLHNLPFHTLYLEEAPLIRRNPIFYQQSLTSWYYQQKEGSTEPFKESIVFGDPQQNLPEARIEAEEVAELLDTTAVVGNAVEKEEVLKSLQQADLIHFTGHGSFNEKGLGLSTSTLNLSGNVRITAEDIINQQSSSQLVILSACDTGRHIGHEGEEQAGLVASFLASGVASVIASQWRVIDADARDFFLLFYPKLLSGKLSVIAMQEAMIESMETKDNFYRWGAFVLWGGE